MEYQQREKVYRAALIPYIIDPMNQTIKMMFMRPSDTTYSGSAWQCAKGRQEENEQLVKTAIREAEEELGLKLNNVSRIERVGNFLGRTDVYVAKVFNQNDFSDPCDETDDVEWLTFQEFMDIGRDIHRVIVRASYAMICDMEMIEPEEEIKEENG